MVRPEAKAEVSGNDSLLIIQALLLVPLFVSGVTMTQGLLAWLSMKPDFANSQYGLTWVYPPDVNNNVISTGLFIIPLVTTASLALLSFAIWRIRSSAARTTLNPDHNDHRVA